MLKLCIFNFIMILLDVIALIICKRYIKSENGKRILFIVAAMLTVVCHYSSLLYHQITDGTAMGFLTANPNLIIPLYPCNVTMLCCIVFAFLRKKNGRLGSFLADYIFWFGVIAALVGLFANVDFIRNPTLLNYDITKSIIAHSLMLFNILLFPVFGYIKIDLPKNYLHIVISIIMMFVIGVYCNVTFETLGSAESAYSANSMFILHSPFDGVPWLTFPTISVVVLIGYFAIFVVAEQIAYKKGERWITRLRKKR